MVTLKELMDYLNDKELFKTDDSSFEAIMNDNGELELITWDGIDDEEVCLLSLNEDFDIWMPSRSVYPFNSGDAYSHLWEDEDNPTVKEFAHAVTNQIRLAYMLECSALYERIFYFNKLIQKNNISEYKLSKDTYGRKWTVNDKTITVEDNE